MQEWLVPVTLTQLRGFLGLVGYYKRFIRVYGVISRPLTDLLEKDSFKWSEVASITFYKLKTNLTTTPVLALPDFLLPFCG